MVGSRMFREGDVYAMLCSSDMLSRDAVLFSSRQLSRSALASLPQKGQLAQAERLNWGNSPTCLHHDLELDR